MGDSAEPNGKWRRNLVVAFTLVYCVALGVLWSVPNLNFVARRDVSLLLALAIGSLLGVMLPGFETRRRIPLTLAVYAGLAIVGGSYVRYRQLYGFASSDFRVEVFARYPQVTNPVCVVVDRQNRLFVVETFAYVNQLMQLSEQVLACRSVEDGLRLSLATGDPPPAPRSERIVRLEDRDHDGVVDQILTVAEGFDLTDGPAGGLVMRGAEAWFTSAPYLWKLELDAQGQVRHRDRLLDGFGVRRIVIGHDLQGAIFGPDGWLYFAMGDRGFNVPLDDGRRLVQLESGAVLRCRPDGKNLQLFATGLRNPRDLVFDQYGNLWTGDNDSDRGDRSRWVYVVEGGDSGWRVGYQTTASRPALFVAEKIFDLQTNLPYRVPAVAHVGTGPAGAAFHPGVAALPARYKDSFLLCSFPKGILAFKVVSRGAGFEVPEVETLVDGVHATDVAFGADGKLYVGDWVDGWQRSDRGRILRVYDQQLAESPEIIETAALLAAGMQQRPEAELCGLLAHADQRVRQDAQFELATRGDGAVGPLLATLAAGQPLLARLHACWAVGQLAAEKPERIAALLPLLNDSEAEVRAQGARVLGDHRYNAATPDLLRLLHDPELRVRFFAAQGLGKLGAASICEPLLAALEQDQSSDPFLRHAVVYALEQIGDVPFLVKAAKRSATAGRLAALLALRRLGRPEIVEFLSDTEPALVIEAVRAIHDAPIDEGLERVSHLLEDRELPELIARRVVNANLRLGTRSAAETLARLAARDQLAPEIRREALDALGVWGSTSARDRVLGCYRVPPTRQLRDAAGALQPHLAAILQTAPPEIAKAAAAAAQALGVEGLLPELIALVRNEQADGELRASALRTLAALPTAPLAEIVPAASESASAPLRREGTALLSRANLPDALSRIEQALDASQPLEIRQAALRALAELDTPAAGEVLVQQLTAATAGQLPAGLLLELLQAAERSQQAAVVTARAALQATTASDKLARWLPALEGGDRQRGRALMDRHGCVRCHKVDGLGGDVGPPIAKLLPNVTRRYLLEAIVTPNAALAEGYQQTTLQLTDGSIFTGRVIAETPAALTLLLATGERREVPVAGIDERAPAQSAMPANFGELLSLSDLRDLVEFLAYTAQSRAL